MTKRAYTVILYPELEEGGYSVMVPSLPGCVTQGETVAECITRAHEAIQVYLEDLEAHGEPIPEEPVHAQAIVIEVAA